MSIGTGIFLSTLVIAALVLYYLLRDRFSWRRFILKAAIYGGGLIIIVTVLGYSYYWYDNRAQTASKLDGLELKTSKEDVYFKYGTPTKICKNKEDESERFVYTKSNRFILVSFEKNVGITRVLGIFNNLYDVKFDGISSAYKIDDEDGLYEYYGDPDFINTINSVERIYVYKNYRSAMILKKNKLVGIAVFDPQFHYLKQSKISNSESNSKWDCNNVVADQ